MSIVIVETVSMFRMRYAVESPDTHPEYALDTVTMEEADEMSQEFLGETIVSHRVVSKDEYLTMFDKDNPECSGWDEAKKMEGVKVITDYAE